MEINLNANLHSVYERLICSWCRSRQRDNLYRLLHGKLPAPCVKHEYIEVEGTGIGFCEYCHSDNMHDGNHFIGKDATI